MKAQHLQPGSVAKQANTAFFHKEQSSSFFAQAKGESSFFPSNLVESPPFQAKLTVGKVGDPYEREADQVADQIVQKYPVEDAGSYLDKTLIQGKSITPLMPKQIPGAKKEEELTDAVEDIPEIEKRSSKVGETQFNELQTGKANNAEETVSKQVSPITIPASISSEPVQLKCADCMEEEKKQEGEEDTYSPEIKRKPVFESNAEPNDDENEIQRTCGACETEGKEINRKSFSSGLRSNNLEKNLDASKGQGSPLDRNTRFKMENAFVTDFSKVRIHNDSNAVQMNKDLNAQAFTHGNDIYFNSGKFDTQSKSGLHLLSHELTHTVQQNANSNVQRLIQRRVIDPHKVMDDIFNEGLGRNYMKVPISYWPAYSDTKWFDRFIDFLKKCSIDPDLIDERPLVYMALLYSSLPNKPLEWHDATFTQTATDSLNSLMNIQFRLPKDATGEMGISIYFSSGQDKVQLDSTTKVTASAFHPLSALNYTIPDTDLSSLQESFEHKMEDGAYKGNSLKFHLTYVLFSPRNSFKLQTIYFNERIQFDLVSKEKLEISFNGKFDIPSHLTIDSKDFNSFDNLLPELIRNAVNLDSTLGGTHSAGGNIETLVMGFTDKKYKLVSLQQLADPSDNFMIRARYFSNRILLLMETFRMGRSFIAEGEPPVHLSFKTLKEAQAKATFESSPGYMIILEGNQYVVYYLTSVDLVWLAKRERGEETEKLPRYAVINIDQIVDLGFYALGGVKTLEEKKSMLQAAYFSSRNEMEKQPPFDSFLCHRLPDGYYSAYPLTPGDVTKTWKSFDKNNGIKNMNSGSDVLDSIALVLRTDEKGLAYTLWIDQNHYEGRDKFARLYDVLNNESDMSKIRTELEKFKDPQLLNYVFNESMRPNSMNPDQFFKEALNQLQGLGGSSLVNTIGAYVFAWVAGEAESKAVEMMESMLAFMDELVNNDMLMKAMLVSCRGRDSSEQKGIAELFTEDEAEAAKLLKILEKDETMNEFLLGNTVDGLSLTYVATQLKSSRDEMKTNLDERKDLHKRSTMRYENLFLVQPGEMGNTIRAHVYDVFGFSLDPKSFPHEDKNKNWFPSPLDENGQPRANLLEQIYINQAINIVHTFKTLQTIKMVAMVTSVFSLARGAGLWAVARAGIASGTFKALVVEALVTSVVAGVMLEGIQVALGKKFSWKDLGFSIAEAFVMMLFFSWINKLFKLPLTRFTVNAALFIGYGVGRFYLEHKRMPNGFEFSLLVAESILMMTLLHIGTAITDPFFRRVLSKYNVDPELRLINENIQKTVKEIAIESGKKVVDKSRVQQLGDQYMDLIKQYRAWLIKNGSKFSKEDVDAELKKLNELEGHWAEAKFVDTTGLVKASQTDTVFYYKPGTDSAKALKEKYGESNVVIDEKTGLGTIKTPEGNVKLIPQETAKQAADIKIDGKSIVDFFGSTVRMVDLGVYAFGKGHLETIKADILKKPGNKWEELGDRVYAAIIEGKRVVFIEEGITVTLDQALAMETKVKGTGMEYLNKSLSESALKGLEILKSGQLKGMSDADILLYLKQVGKGIQEKNYPNNVDGEPFKSKPQSFTEYLEKIYQNRKSLPDKTGPTETTPRKPALEPVVENAPKGQEPSVDGKRSLRMNEKGKCEICASPCDEVRLRYKAVLTPALEKRIAAIEKNGKLTDAQKLEKLKPIEQKLSELNDKTAKDITNEIKKGRIKPKGGKWRYANNWKKWVGEKKGRVIEYADGSFDYIEPGGTKVRYNPEGYPDYSPYLDHPSGIKQVDIDKFDARRWPDYQKANEKVGKGKEWGKEPPDDYAWHHHQNGKTMQLVPEWIHVLFRHAGGVSNL